MEAWIDEVIYDIKLEMQTFFYSWMCLIEENKINLFDFVFFCKWMIGKDKE